MRYDRLFSKNRRPEPVREPVPAPPPTAGARPLSPVQRAYYGIEEASKPHVRESEPYLRRTAAGRRRMARNRRPQKKRILRIALSVLAVALLSVGAVALLTHPRLQVRHIILEGNRSIPTETALGLVGAVRGRNLILLPVGRLEKALLREPTFESVEAHRVFPDSVRISVRERQPWAVLVTGDGKCFTLDRTLTPFRSPAVPEKGLPVVSVELEAAQAGVTPGQTLRFTGAEHIPICLEWARKCPDFRFASLTIARDGKLCLNRNGGAQARLGSPLNLERKLHALKLILQQPAVQTQDWEYINLIAYDSPAVKFKPTPKVVSNGAEAIVASPLTRAPSGRSELP